MDGEAAHFWIGGKTPFADALWWKELGANAKVSHFTYDVYFYYKTAGAPQALEFDTNQNVDGRRYIFGTQCDVAARQFDVWNTSGAYWMHRPANLQMESPDLGVRTPQWTDILHLRHLEREEVLHQSLRRLKGGRRRRAQRRLPDGREQQGSELRRVA